MPFRFSLEEVLDHRRHVEELRQRELAQAQAEVDQVENLLGQARQRRSECREEYAEKARTGLSMGWQEIYGNYLHGLERLIRGAEEHLEGLRQERDRRRQVLLEASRDREVLDELKREERRLYEMEERRAEQREFDEIAVRQFDMRRREAS